MTVGKQFIIINKGLECGYAIQFILFYGHIYLPHLSIILMLFAISWISTNTIIPQPGTSSVFRL